MGCAAQMGLFSREKALHMGLYFSKNKMLTDGSPGLEPRVTTHANVYHKQRVRDSMLHIQMKSQGGSLSFHQGTCIWRIIKWIQGKQA